MARPARKNLHLPLPARTYDELSDEAERVGVPTTTLARRAVEDWLAARRRAAVAEAIAEYAAAVAGTEADLDPELERAALDELAARPRSR